MVRAAEVKDVAAVDVMVQGFLNQVLRLVAGELRHPGEELGGCVKKYVRCVESSGDEAQIS